MSITEEMINNKLALYDVEWQILRVFLLGKWNSPADNIKKLEEYLGDCSNFTKLWRVLNLLSGVRLGFSQRGVSWERTRNEADRDVQIFLNKVSVFYHKAKKEGEFEIASQEKIKEDFEKADIKDVKKVYYDLKKRLVAHKESVHREELRYFVNLLEDFIS